MWKKMRGSGELPSRAQSFDAITPDRISIAAAATVVLLKIIVPKGMIAVIERFGHDLETAAAFDKIEWSFRIFEKTFPPSAVEWRYDVAGTLTKGEQYKSFKAMLGPMYDPFWFPVPFILNARDTFEVLAKNTDTAAHTALARLVGYAYEDLDP